MLNKLFRNYDAWSVDQNQFYKLRTTETKLKFLLKYAILAPSSHNTQPWKFTVSNNYIDIYADLSRKLEYSDPSGRMIYTAIGCAVQNIKIAACHYGLSVQIIYNHQLLTTLPRYTMRICLSETKSSNTSEDEYLFPFITQRASSRGRYRDAGIPQEVLVSLRKLLHDETVKACIITDKDVKSAIATYAGGAMKAKMSIRAFRNELAKWLRTNITLKRDGMPGSGHNMPLGVSLIAPFILRHKDVSDFEQARAVKRVINFPAVCIISSREDNALEWIKSGELLERILLAITAAQMSASLMAAPIEVQPEREKLQRAIAEQNDEMKELFPQVFLGFGFSSIVAPHSPRRKLNDTLT